MVSEPSLIKNASRRASFVYGNGNSRGSESHQAVVCAGYCIATVINKLRSFSTVCIWGLTGFIYASLCCESLNLTGVVVVTHINSRGREVFVQLLFVSHCVKNTRYQSYLKYDSPQPRTMYYICRQSSQVLDASPVSATRADSTMRTSPFSIT